MVTTEGREEGGEGEREGGRDGGRKEGRKEGMKEGRKEGREEGKALVFFSTTVFLDGNKLLLDQRLNRLETLTESMKSGGCMALEPCAGMPCILQDVCARRGQERSCMWWEQHLGKSTESQRGHGRK